MEYLVQCATESCDRPCFSDNPEQPVDVECFVLDNNGYVVVSQEPLHTGQFFGEVRGRIMERLVVEQIYQEVTITDYQAVCFERKKRNSPGNMLQTPLVHVMKLVHWLAGLIAWSAIRLAALLPVEAFNYDEYSKCAKAKCDPCRVAYNSQFTLRISLRLVHHRSNGLGTQRRARVERQTQNVRRVGHHQSDASAAVRPGDHHVHAVSAEQQAAQRQVRVPDSGSRLRTVCEFVSNIYIY